MKTMIISYIKLEQLTDEVKKRHKIKIGALTPRFDATLLSGQKSPLKRLKNGKGMIHFYLVDAKNVVTSSKERKADKILMAAKDSLNLSSIYVYGKDAKGNIVGFGNPNGKPTIGKDKKPNPFYAYKDDGYLFVISENWKTIDVFTIKDGNYTKQGNASLFIDGEFDNQIKAIKAQAKPIFKY